jgi:hypothetical protein
MRVRHCIIAGALICTNESAAFAQPINLLGPTQTPNTVQATPLALPRPGTSLPMMPAVTGYNYDTAVPPLESAQAALGGRRYGLAAEDLEAAETRLLNEGAAPNGSRITSGGQALAQVRLARDATKQRDRRTAMIAVSMAIAAAQQPVTVLAPPVAAEAPSAPALPVAVAPPSPSPPPRPVPTVTQAMLPGHWQMGSWQYHWVAPQMALRPVETRTVQQGQFVWKTGEGWVWVPTHYVND